MRCAALLLAALVLAAGPARGQAGHVERDIAYGADPRQRLDAYLPPQPSGPAPILVMVHGGGWRAGNKTLPQVVDQKVAHWVVEGGAIFVSVGYRLVPQVGVPDQADDIARALAKVQALAPSWGGDPRGVVLMGHSAAAHLVALVGASPAGFAAGAGAMPWLGTVALDGAALDPEALMAGRHARLYDPAFGADPAVWRAASPTAALAAGAPPLLLVCSTLRIDASCEQARSFAARATAVGVAASVSPQPMTHAEINAELGRPNRETEAVDDFLGRVGWR